jgi:hypothetical protein
MNRLNKLLYIPLLSTIVTMILGCFADTTNPQVSLSIAESKREGLFIKEYYLKNVTVKDFVVEDAWIEKGSSTIRKACGRYVKQKTGVNYVSN